jgi:hypothetical protein
MFRKPVLTLAFATFVSVTSFASVAFAGEPKSPAKKGSGKPKPKTAIVAAAVEPLPALPAADPTSAPPPAPVAPMPPIVTNPAVTADRPVEAPAQTTGSGTGFVLAFASGVTRAEGQVVDGVDFSATFAMIDIRIGGYITPHFGVVGGIRGGYGEMTQGCVGRCNRAWNYQLPVLAEYAFVERARGPYVTGGFALLPTYAGSSDEGGSPPMTFSNLADLKLGVGMRFPFVDGSRTTFDVRVGGDAGKFTGVRIREAGGEVADDKRAWHYAVGLDLAVHFAM